MNIEQAIDILQHFVGEDDEFSSEMQIVQDMHKALDIALAALREKQIREKKPCHFCNETDKVTFADSTVYPQFRFCPHCGRALTGDADNGQ